MRRIFILHCPAKYWHYFQNPGKPVFEFHISREARDYYGFDQKLFEQSGNVIFSDYYQVRVFADKMNKKRNLAAYPEKAIKAGQLNAMGLIDEILHYIIGIYKSDKKTTVVKEALGWLQKKVGMDNLDKSLQSFVDHFPSVSVYRNEMSSTEYLKNEKNRELVLEEILLLYLANINPAFEPFKELFDDTLLMKNYYYHELVKSFDEFFSDQPRFGPENQIITEMLYAPASNVPHSLSGQLKYMFDHWGLLIARFIYRILSAVDLIKEEEKARFAGAGPAEVIDYRKLILEDEYERFSSDLDWMPKVVMIAKNSYVWLYQLSKKYNRSITKLNEIPDEELDLLASHGFSALWLIGLWERSHVSQKIKKWCGNPEAVSSAYSVFDYTIANDLGGEEAYQNLRLRAWQRGIRLASDMVPNHTGIYSRWMIEHPDWFIQSDHSPFPSYRFSCENLSDDRRVGIYIEDGYWQRNDAAVVCKRVDHYTGETRYIYHGNDGTSMPWNDTAQLDFLKAEVREAVIQQILHVARKFSIIRFDAAMTLAKRHFQRLWYPQPGSGGDIPSRAGFAMSAEQFNRLFPNEFWREVVDRVAREVPGTLLLAEAFWLMEGYFVRTLGMHRVYNSAFMNMLKNEDNQKYRQSIKNVMEFNPEILKRHVNFMSNPDEETAVAQFGEGDKYFGVCVMLVTMPGLPMFAHGQVEGYTEKYGMEYKRAYWDEQEDSYLIQRHEREIFPLMKKRYLFSEVRNFVLYDFYTAEGYVNEDVFAYSNYHEDERCLVIYNNKYGRTKGWIRTSCATATKNGNYMMQVNIREGLGLSGENNMYTIFRDHISGLQFIRRNSDLATNGLYNELDGFKYHVFIDFRQVRDNQFCHYEQLTQYLNGNGVPDIDDILNKIILQPIHEPFRVLISHIYKKQLKKKGFKKIEIEFTHQLKKFMAQFKNYLGDGKNMDEIMQDLKSKFSILLRIKNIAPYFHLEKTKILDGIVKYITENLHLYGTVYSWIITHQLGRMKKETDYEIQSVSWMDEYLLSRIIYEAFQKLGLDDYHASRQVLLLKALIIQNGLLEKDEENVSMVFETLIQDQEVQTFLQLNRYQGILYLNKESLEEVLAAKFYLAVVNLALEEDRLDPNTIIQKLQLWYKNIKKIKSTAKKAKYRVEKIREYL
jgi:glycosidase